MRKSINNSRKSRRGRGMKKVFACLLGLSMIPMNDFVVKAATENQVKTQVEVKTLKNESSDTIGFEKDEDRVNIGYFGEIPVKSDTDYKLKITSSDRKILDIYKDEENGRMTKYYYSPRSTGSVILSAKYTANDGQIYTYTMKVEVIGAEDGILPIKSYNMYHGLYDEKGYSLDKNSDFKISYEEFNKAYEIIWNAYDYESGDYELTDADLDLLKYAPNCEYLDLGCNEKITDINKVLGYMKKIKEIHLEETSVSDFSGLYSIKEQLKLLRLPYSYANMDTRFKFLKDRTYVKSGEYIYADSLAIKDVLPAWYDYTFSSSDPNVIEVKEDESGKLVMYAKEGAEGKSANVTVEYKDDNGEYKKTIQMVVTDQDDQVPITEVKINKSSINLTSGQTDQLTVSYLPDYVKDGFVTWSSSNDTVASVDENGKVTAKAAGTAVITAKSTSGVTATCEVVVKGNTSGDKNPSNPEQPSSPTQPIQKPSNETPTQPTTEAPTQTTTTTSQKVEKITIKGISKNIAAGKKVKLTATVTPENAANKSVTWTTSNKKVATVNASGVVSVNKKAGGKSVTITATAKDGSGQKATYKIKVMKGAVKKVKISGKKSVKAGKTLKLKAKVKASKGANKKLIWTSSNEKYATVSSSGKVKALTAGKKKSVKITAMATDGSGKKATVTIKIK